jgi:hypothetical protein
MVQVVPRRSLQSILGDLTDVYAAVMADFPYEACVHVHYPESVLPVKDGLLKMRDLLQEKGSSGVSVVE